jgi:hypothetical protein
MVGMNESRLEQFGKHVLAGILMLIVGLIVLKVVFSMIAALFIPIFTILVIVGIVWAIRVLL